MKSILKLVFFLVSVVSIQVAFAEEENKDIDPVCLQPLVEGGCWFGALRYFFNLTAGRCERFFYKGCDANLNHFVTIVDCRRICNDPRCFQAVDTGKCSDDIPRYAYNPTSGNCEQFSWTGCDGNSNNFETLDDCRRICNDPICFQPIETGKCSDDLPRYAYNSTSGNCEQFSWTGCDGNANNFKTLDECCRACSR